VRRIAQFENYGREVTVLGLCLLVVSRSSAGRLSKHALVQGISTCGAVQLESENGDNNNLTVFTIEIEHLDYLDMQRRCRSALYTRR
jgi:hypothetical protein